MQIALSQATATTTEKPAQAVLVPIAPVSIVVSERKIEINEIYKKAQESI